MCVGWATWNLSVLLSLTLSDLLNCANSGSFSRTSPVLEPNFLGTALGRLIKNFSVSVGIPLFERCPIVVTTPQDWGLLSRSLIP